MFCLECCDADTNELGNDDYGLANLSEAQAEPPSETNSPEFSHPGEDEQATDPGSKSSGTLTTSERFCRPHAGILRGLTLRESLRKGGDLWRYRPQQLWLHRAGPHLRLFFSFFLSVCLSVSLSLSLSERQANVLVYTCFYYIHILHKSKEVLKDSCVLCPLFAPA